MRSVLLTAILLASAASGASAQRPTEGGELTAWRDSLSTWPDGTLRSRVAATPRGGDPEVRLRSGWVLTIAGERFDSAALLVRAADEFYEVTVRRPREVEGWFGLGYAKSRLAHLHAREVRSAHQPPGMGWASGSTRALVQAIRLDSTFLPANVELAKLAPLVDGPARSVDVWAAIDRSLQLDSADATLWVIAGRSARARKDHAGALRAFEHALSLATVDTGGVTLERAKELFALDRPEEAEGAYYAGAAFTDSLGLIGYRKDIGYIADPSALAEWDSLTPASRPDWLRDFWARREREAGRPAGSRLIEHERRIRYAVEHFGRIPMHVDVRAAAPLYRGALEDIDARGEVYIRHGEPDGTAGYVGGMRTPPNVSWLYYRPEGNILLHFIDSAGIWQLVPSLFDFAGSQAVGLYESRMGLDPRLGVFALRLYGDSILFASNSKVAGVGGQGTYDPANRQFLFSRQVDVERRTGRDLIAHAMHTDSDPVRFEREFEPIVQVFGASNRTPGLGRLLVVTSLPASDHLTALPLPDGGAGYVLRMRVTAADDHGRTTLDRDTLVRVRTRAVLREGEFLSLVNSFELPATGEQRVRVILTDSARTYGAVRIINGVPVPDLTALPLGISDLIVGSDRSGVVWRRPDGGQVALHPVNAWRRDDALEVNFELVGLSPAESYRVRIGIADLGADSTRPPRASIEYDARAEGTRELVSQRIALGALRPGRYILTVTVTAGDRSVRRERRITVVR